MEKALFILAASIRVIAAAGPLASIVTCLAAAPAGIAAGLRIEQLRCEYLKEPLGVDVPQPRLSWVLESKARGEKQTACQILVASSAENLKANKGDLWDSGKLPTAESAQLAYGGQPLTSRKQCYWKVRVWDQEGKASGWSDPARWGMGFLDVNDWQAKWISAHAEANDAERLDFSNVSWIWYPNNTTGEVILFRKELNIDDSVSQVDVETTVSPSGDNRFRVYLNGQEIDESCGWGWPSFSRIQLRAKTDLKPGRNVLAVAARHIGPNAGLFCAIRLHRADTRTTETLPSTGWLGCDQTATNWALPGFSDAAWVKPSLLAKYGEGDWGKFVPQYPPRLPWLRKNFTLKSTARQAMAYVSALGYYELYINGRKVDDYVLTPGVSDFRKRALYLAHDITKYLVQGDNCVALWLGRGWYTPGVPGVTHSLPLVKAELHVELANGQAVRLGTDTTWKTRSSSFAGSNFGNLGPVNGGEIVDASAEDPSWNSVDADMSRWVLAQEFNPPMPLISGQNVEANRIRQTITPVGVERLEYGVYLIDMGRNFNGFFELRIPGEMPAGRKLTFIYGDKRWGGENLQTYDQRDEYIAKGGGNEVFRNRFFNHAFRWVKVIGLDHPPALGDARGYLVHTDYELASEFECSNDVLNRIYQTVCWTYRCLTLGGYIVDCPHRERLGYGGDAGTSMETGLSNFRVGALYSKWLRDWRDTQLHSGEVDYTAPSFGTAGGPAWSGICVSLPWHVYLQYGDRQVLLDMYPTIQTWLGFLETKTKDGYLEYYMSSRCASPRGNFLGDWLPPGRGMWDDRVDDYSTLFFNNCYYVYNLRLAAKIAAVLQRPADAEQYHKKAETRSQAIHKRFYNADKKSYANGEQPYLAMPLLLGIVPEPLKAVVAGNLEHEIRVTNKGHLNTGMHGTYFLLRYLTDVQRHDLTYQMVNQTTFPGWGYMLQQGATTIWEEWGGANSQIHDTLISVGMWFLQGVGGIQVDEKQPGFKHFILRPVPVGDLKWAKTKYESIHGTIVSDWRIEDDQFELNVTIPVNTTASVYVPAASSDSVQEGSKQATKAEGVQFLRMEDQSAVFEVASGNYQFLSRRPPSRLCSQQPPED